MQSSTIHRAMCKARKESVRRLVCILTVAALAASAWAAEQRWRDDLWLGRGGFWRARVGVTVENTSDEAWEGRSVSVPLAKLPLAGARVEELRLVDARGVQLEYGVWDGRSARVAEGPVPPDGTFVIPVVCAAHGTAGFQIYYDNPSAWGLADFWTERPVAPLPEPKVAVGAAERLDAREIGADAPWLAAKPGEGAWQYRVPVRLANFTAETRFRTLGACPLVAALRATRAAEYVFTLNGNALRTCRLGDQLLFSCDLPARSISTFYLYVRRRRCGAETKPEELKSALGSEIPSDQVLVKRPSLGNVDVFEELLNGPANLVRNPGWEAGATDWISGTGNPGGIRYEVVAEGGRFGKAFAKTVIPRTVRPNWNGWRQAVKVKPGHTYLYGAFISGDDLQTAATVHVHQRTAKGTLARGGMISAGRGVNGTAPWTPVFGTARATDDADCFDLHLTMNGAGTVAYDGVLVAEYTAARTGDPEFPAAAEGGAPLRVAQVDPVVKVFRETPVEEAAGAAFAVSLARNETEPLQLAVRTARAVADLKAQVELPAPLKAEVGRVRHVPVDHPTAYYSCTTPAWELRYPRNGGSSDGWSGWWPDPIDPVAGGPAPANETQAFWINVTAGADVPPGTYKGKITWMADGAAVRTDAFSVKVWNFALEARPSFPAIYDLRVGDRWKVLGATPAERRERLWALLAEKKCCPDRLGVEVKFAKGADGTVTADFTEYDAVAARYFDHYRFPVSYMPGCFYCFGWAMPPKPFLGENPYEGAWPYEGADWTKLRPAYKNLYQQALRLYWNHVKEKGWAQKLVLYISDEPHFHRANVVQQMKACCAMIHEVDPKIQIYSSTWRHCPAWNDSLDVWGVGHYGCFPVDEMRARVKAGSRIWWTTDGQMCTDTPYCAVERLLPHYARAFGADAYEFWGCTWLTYDPWKFGWHADGGAKPVSTIRLEAARDGVEDYNYLVLLERLAAEKGPRSAEAARLVDELRALVAIPNAGGRYSTSILPEPEKLASLRLRAGELLAGSDARPALSRRFGTSSHEHRKSAALD